MTQENKLLESQLEKRVKVLELQVKFISKKLRSIATELSSFQTNTIEDEIQQLPKEESEVVILKEDGTKVSNK